MGQGCGNEGSGKFIKSPLTKRYDNIPIPSNGDKKPPHRGTNPYEPIPPPLPSTTCFIFAMKIKKNRHPLD
jgi:hypothetical protein